MQHNSSLPVDINADVAEPTPAARIAIIGAGPLGIEAAHYALRLGFSVRIFEAENEIAPTIRQWQHLSFFSPWGQVRTPLGDQITTGGQADPAAIAPSIEDAGRGIRAGKLPRATVFPTGEEMLRLYLEPLARALPSKTLYLGCKVVGITRAYLFPADHADLPMLRTRHPFRIVTRNTFTGEERAWSADSVIDCTSGGRVPAWMGCGGLPALGEMGCAHRIYRHTPDILGKNRGEFAAKKTLLIGDGTSAATTAILLAELAAAQEGTQFYWVVKSDYDLPCAADPTIESASRRDVTFAKANLLVKQGQPFLAYSKRTQVEEIRYLVDAKKFFVTLQVDRQTKRYQFDNLVSNVGSRRETSYIKHLIPNEPGFFEIGEDHCIPTENFLKAGHAQIRDTFQVILGDRSVDLYSQVAKAA